MKAEEFAALDQVDAAEAVESALEEAESEARERSESRGRVKRIAAIVALGLGAVWLGSQLWPQGRSPAPPAPRLLPSSPNPTAGPIGGVSRVAPQLPAPTGPAEPGEPAPPAAQQAPRGGTVAQTATPAQLSPAWSDLLRAQQDVAMEEQRMRLAELKLKRVRAEIEAREIERRPERLFGKDAGNLPAALSQLPRVPPPPPAPVVTRGPVPPSDSGQVATPQAGRPEAPPLRVLLVSEQPEPEALVQALDGSGGGGLFSLKRGDRLPEFTVVSVDARGLTISAGGRGYFYPVGGMAIGQRPPAIPAQTASAGPPQPPSQPPTSGAQQTTQRR